MKIRIAVGIALLGSLALPARASAEKPVWKSIAMACVPTSDTAAKGGYVTSGGRIKLAPGQLGTISFVCPFDEARHLSLHKEYRLRAYVKRVTTRRRPREYVKAVLRAARDKTGDVFTILETDDDDFVDGSGPMVQVFSRREIIGWSADLTYYVQLTLKREEVDRSGGVEQIPEILSVEVLEK